MDAVLLAISSAVLFGAMTVALRLALAGGASAHGGALFTILPALGVAAAFALARPLHLAALWPYLLTGLLGPGLSQVLFTLAVRDAGPSRTSVAVGTAPLFSVAIALAVLGEPLRGVLLAGALLVVAGGVLLAAERGRPGHVKLIGLAFAVGSTVAFAVRDNLLRHLSLATDASPASAAAATLAAGAAAVAVYLALTRAPVVPRAFGAFVPAGMLFGLSYVCLFEAYSRARVTVVSPLVATESLWGVLFSVLLLRRTELVGRRLLAGALLVVAGGALIGAGR